MYIVPKRKALLPKKIDCFCQDFIKLALGYNKIKMNSIPLNRLKVVLVEKQKTSKWLAEQLGVSAVTVSKWCSNIHQPDLYTLARIADLIGCDKRDLLTE